MEKMTVTEALAEVKLIQKKIEKKKATITANTARFEHMKDPYGDTASMIKEELQSIEDLYAKLTRLRTSVSKANLDTRVSIGGHDKTVTEWLTWKKEVYEPLTGVYSGLTFNATQEIKKNTERPSLVKNENTNDPATLAKLVVNVDIPTLNKKAEQIVEIHEKLDGLLSLKNATVTVEF